MNAKLTRRDALAYLRRLGPVKHGIREPLDFTPNYAASPVALVNLSLLCPGAKVLMILRDPVDRFYSAVDHAKQVGAVGADTTDIQAFKLAHLSWKPWINGFLQQGMYVPAYEAACAIFGQQRVFVTSLDLMRSPSTAVSEFSSLARFLEVDPSLFDGAVLPHSNASGSRKGPFAGLPPTERTEEGMSALTTFYEPWRKRVREIIEIGRL